MTEETYNVGISNIEYDVLDNNRQERKRKTTDVAPLVIYCMFIVAWIDIAIYAYTHSRVPPLEIVKQEMKFLGEYLFFSPAILFFTWFCILLIVFYFIMLRWCTKFTLYLTIFLEFLLITLPFITVASFQPAIGIPILLLCYLIFWIEIQILKKAGIDMICKIIVDACKASIAFPSSLLIVLLFLFLYFLFGTFVATVIYSLVNCEYKLFTKQPLHLHEMYSHKPQIFSSIINSAQIEMEHIINSEKIKVEDIINSAQTEMEHIINSEKNKVEDIINSAQIEMEHIINSEQFEREHIVKVMALIITFSLLSLWIFIVENFCMQFLLHGMFTSWCRMPNKSVIPRFTIALRYYSYAYRYHTGSFAFMAIPIAPIIQIIRTICANIHLLEMKFKESPYNIYCFLVVIGNMVSNSSVVCASYGKCFYPSMKGAFKVIVQNSMKFAAARLIITGMIFFGLILIPGIMIGVVLLHIAIWNPINYGIYLAVTAFVSSIITAGVLCIFSAAADSVLFCHLEELINSEANADEVPKNNHV